MKQATGRFPLDSRLLGYNAPHSRDLHRARRRSWICISLALRAGLAGRLDSGCGCNVLAPGWLRQKIIWQKASLPYLFRLADVAAQTVQAEDVTVLQQLIDRGTDRIRPNANPAKTAVRLSAREAVSAHTLANNAQTVAAGQQAL